MFEIKIAPQAAADLLEIKDYIENELQNPIAAHNTISKIICQAVFKNHFYLIKINGPTSHKDIGPYYTLSTKTKFFFKQ